MKPGPSVMPRWKTTEPEWRGTRWLTADEPRPEGEPKRYKSGEYVKLRWKLGRRQYVETYERDEAGNLVRTRPMKARQIDYGLAAELYRQGLSLPQVARELAIDSGNLSRRLRSMGVPMRAKRDYSEPFDEAALLELYQSGIGVEECARRVGATNTQAARVIRAAGLMRGPGSTKHAPGQTYQHEFRKQRPAVMERSGGRCEAVVSDSCTGVAEMVHHKKLRRHGGTNELANLLAACNACHLHIHNHPAQSYELGLLIRGVR